MRVCMGVAEPGCIAYSGVEEPLDCCEPLYLGTELEASAGGGIPLTTEPWFPFLCTP